MALCLSRKVGEGFRIGGSVWVRVVKVNRREVRLEIDAPERVPILREELLATDDDADAKELEEDAKEMRW